MNYHLTLICGDSADFFLEEWKPGGVSIADDVVGLFDARRQEEELLRSLDVYQLRRVSFDLTSLLKIGICQAWSWRAMGWEGAGPRVRLAADRIRGLLVDGFPSDNQRRVEVLKLIQAASKEFGPPASIDGVFRRPNGREDRVTVYRSGGVGYDSTPHPMPLLEEIAGVIRPPD